MLICLQVISANVLQISLLFFFWPVLRVLVVRHKKFWYDFSPATSDHLQASLIESSQGMTTIAALLNLQKTQCGFALALDVAILVASGSRTALGAVSIADLKVNLDALRLLAMGGTILPVLTQYLLQELHKSWGLFSLSVTTALCSFIIQRATLKASRWTFVPENCGPWMDACGGVSPTNLCDLAYSLSYKFDTVSLHNFAFAVLCFGLFIVFMCLYFKQSTYFGIWWPLYDIGFVALLSLYSSRLPTLLDRNTSIDQSGWSFGQVVAMTLWVPLILEWCYGMSSECQSTLHHNFTDATNRA